MGVVVGTANHEGWNSDPAEIHVKEREALRVFRGQVRAATARCREKDTGTDARVGKILAPEPRTKKQATSEPAEGMSGHCNLIMAQTLGHGRCLPLNLDQLVEDGAHLRHPLAPVEGPVG